MSFNFTAAVIICNDFGAKENEVCHCFHCFPIYFPWSDGTGCHNLNFFECWVLSQLFHSFTFIKRFFSFSSLSAISSVQSLSHVRLFATPWTATHQASLSITNSWSLPKLMSIESVMPSNRLILLSPSPPALNLSQHQGLFQRVSSLHQVAKVLEFQLQHQYFQWIFRTDFL